MAWLTSSRSALPAATAAPETAATPHVAHGLLFGGGGSRSNGDDDDQRPQQCHQRDAGRDPGHGPGARRRASRGWDGGRRRASKQGFHRGVQSLATLVAIVEELRRVPANVAADPLEVRLAYGAAVAFGLQVIQHSQTALDGNVVVRFPRVTGFG